MTKPEGATQLQIGMLVLELSVLQKQIGKLLDEISQRATIFALVGRLLVFLPERLPFEGRIVDGQFSGEPEIDWKAIDVDSLIAELRAGIVGLPVTWVPGPTFPVSAFGRSRPAADASRAVLHTSCPNVAEPTAVLAHARFLSTAKQTAYSSAKRLNSHGR
jgi:hypothetical protein